MQATDPIGKLGNIIREILGQLRMAVETNDESLVFSRPHHLVQKLDGGILFEYEAVADRAAGVHYQSHPQGQVGGALKIQNALWRRLIVQHREILLGKILDKFAVGIGGAENDIDLVHPLANS